MTRIESSYRAFRATVPIPRDKSWDDLFLTKPAEKKGGYVKVAVKKKREPFSFKFKL